MLFLWETVGVLLSVLAAALAALMDVKPVLVAGLVAVLALCLIRPARCVPMTLACMIALCPFAGTMSGRSTETHKTLLFFSFSDVLIFAVLPGSMRLMWQTRRTTFAHLPHAARQYGIWALIFIGICAVSFVLNRHAMGKDLLTYAAGGFRVVQIVGLLPLLFGVASWDRSTLRVMWSGYLISAFVFGETVAAMYLNGLGKVPIFGVHKNAVGLIVLTGVLIALVSRWSSKMEQLVPPRLGNLVLIVGMPALAASSSRGSLLCFLLALLVLSVWFRQWKLPVALVVVLGISLLAATKIQPVTTQGADISVSLEDHSVQARFAQLRNSWDRFLQSPLWGDGLRARKDTTPHNLEILLLAETGVLGLIAFGGVLTSQFALFRHAAKTLPRDAIMRGTLGALAICAVALLTHAQFDPFWRRGPLFLLSAGMGIVCSLLRENASADNV